MRGGLRWLLRPFQVVCVLVAVLLTAAFSLRPGFAGHADGNAPIPDKPNLGSRGERLNANTISIISGNPNATYLTIAYDLSDVLDDGDNFRILPVIGKGGGQNINDVRFLKGIDLGITQSIILNEYRANNTIGNIDNSIDSIAKLFNEEMHVVVRANSGITSLEQLDGKKVNFSNVGSGSQLSSHDIFARLGVHPIEVNMGQSDAVQKLKTGELAATILIAGKSAGLMGKLRASQGLRFLPVAFAKPLQTDYLPAVLTHADYPGMIEEGHDINTIAVSAVLICFNLPPVPGGAPTVPGAPAALIVPGAPAVPVVPGAPAALTVPGAPAALIVPGAPAALIVPGAPAVPVVPGAPAALRAPPPEPGALTVDITEALTAALVPGASAEAVTLTPARMLPPAASRSPVRVAMLASHSAA